MSDSDSYSEEQPPKSGIDSPNETHFHPSDAPPDKQRKARRLWFYNEDLKRDRSNTNAKEVRRREKNHLLDAISCSLELPEYQHKEAEKIVSQSNFTESVEGRYLSLEIYCFAVCILVHNQNVRKFTSKFLPQKSDERNPDLIVRFRDEIEVTNEEISQALEELEYEVVKNV